MRSGYIGNEGKYVVFVFNLKIVWIIVLKVFWLELFGDFLDDVVVMSYGNIFF